MFLSAKNLLSKYLVLTVLSGLVMISIACTAEKVVQEEGPTGTELAEQERKAADLEMQKLWNLGYSAAQVKEFDKALEYYETVLTMDAKWNPTAPEHNALIRSIGKIYREMNQHEKALEYFERGLKITPDDLYMNEMTTYYYQQKGDIEKYIPAVLRLIPLLDTDQKKLPYLTNLKNFYKQLQRNEEALVTIERIIAITPEDMDLKEERVSLIQLTKGSGAVIKEIEELHSLNPTDTDLMWQLIDNYRTTSEFAKAIEMLDKVKAVNPDDVTVLEQKRDIYFSDLQDERNGMKMLTELVAAQPNEPTHLTEIAKIHLLNQNYETAAGYGSRALRVNRSFGEANYVIAEAIRGQVDAVKDPTKITFEDKLVNEIAYYYYKAAVKDATVRSKAQRIIDYMDQGLIPTDGDRFMNKSVTKPSNPKYQWPLKYKK